jgi:hypothetical protein
VIIAVSEKEKRDIQEMVKTAKYLAENDPQSLVIAKTGLDMLKARCDMDKAMREPEQEGA